MRVEYEVVGPNPNRIKLRFVAQSKKDQELLTMLERKMENGSIFVRGASVSTRLTNWTLTVKELEMFEKRD